MSKRSNVELCKKSRLNRAGCFSCNWTGYEHQAEKHAREHPGHEVTVERIYSFRVKGSSLVMPELYF